MAVTLADRSRVDVAAPRDGAAVRDAINDMVGEPARPCDASGPSADVMIPPEAIPRDDASRSGAIAGFIHGSRLRGAAPAAVSSGS